MAKYRIIYWKHIPQSFTVEGDGRTVKKQLSQKIQDKTVYIYPFEGSVEIADRVLKTHQGGVLGSGDTVEVKAGADGARFLVLAARPIREPIVQYGPFVMNTREEIMQAVDDYRSGKF